MIGRRSRSIPALVVMMVIAACGGGGNGGGASTVNQPGNRAPTADAGSDKTVQEGEEVTLDGAAADSDGGIASIQWTQVEGPVTTIQDADSVTASIVAPVVTAPETLIFQLTVTDDQGVAASDTVTVRVMPVNVMPMASAGDDQTAFSGDTITLAGTGTDIDGTIVQLEWTQASGTTVSLSNANTGTPSFVAPAVGGEHTLVFLLTATDNEGGAHSDTVTITVFPSQLPVTQPPTIAPGGGPFQTQVTITLASSTAGAVIYYTLDGSTPSRASTLYMGPFVLTASATVTAVAIQDGFLDSAMTTAQFTLDSPGTDTRPNVLVFLADDMGWGDSAVYNADSKIPTPNLEILAANGMVFTDAHTSAAKCAPSRYSAISGNYQWRGLEKWGTWNYKGEAQILPGQWTVGDILQQEGYNTAIVGKLHLGGEFYEKGSNEFASRSDSDDVVDFSRPFEFGPKDYGFDFSYVLLRGIQDSPYAYFRNNLLVGDPASMVTWTPGAYSGSIINTTGPGTPDYSSKLAGPRLATEAIDFIDRHHQRNLDNGTDQPFFLYYASQSAHGPYTPPETFLGEPVNGVTGIETHSDMIYEIDVALGKLVQALEERDLLNDTLIIFTSDNGGLLRSREIDVGHDAVGGLRGQKGRIWEGGHRVPFIVRWGDGTLTGSRVPPGSVRHQLIGVQDLMASFTALVERDLLYDQGRDSFNILPVFLGEQDDQAPVRDHIILQADRGEEIWAYREANWKLVMDDDFDITDFYDLDSDISETNNLVNDPDQALRIAELHARFLERRAADRTTPSANP